MKDFRDELTSGETSLISTLDSIRWDAFAHGVFSEWYVQDLLQLELSPDDVGVDGFANESLRHLKHVLDVTAKASRYSTLHSPSAKSSGQPPSPLATDAAITDLCESTSKRLSDLGPQLGKLNVDQLTHSGFFNLLSAVVRGQSSDHSEMINKRIHAVLEARRAAVLEGESQLGSADMLLSVNAKSQNQPDQHFLQLVRLQEEKVEENRKALLRLSNPTYSPSQSAKSTPRKTIEAAQVASGGASPSPRRNQSFAAQQLNQVNGACQSFLRHKKADPSRVSSDLAKLEGYMTAQEAANEAAGEAYNKHKEATINNVARITLDMKVAVEAINEQQKLLAQLASDKADEIKSLIHIEELEKQRRSKHLTLTKACHKYKECLMQIGEASPEPHQGDNVNHEEQSTQTIKTANEYVSIVQDCARQCSELLAKRESILKTSDEVNPNRDLDLPMATAAVSVLTNPLLKEDGNYLYRRTIMKDYHDSLTALAFNLMAELVRMEGDTGGDSKVSDWGVESQSTSKPASPGEGHNLMESTNQKRMSKSSAQDRYFVDITSSPTRFASNQLKEKINKIEEEYKDLLVECDKYGIVLASESLESDSSRTAPFSSMQLKDKFEEFWSQHEFALQAVGRRPLVVEDPDTQLGVKVFHPKHSTRSPTPLPEDKFLM